MKKKIFLILLICSVLPIAGTLIFIRLFGSGQESELTQKRLSSVNSGVIGFCEQSGADVLAQVKSLSENDDLKRTMLLINEIGFIDQTSLIKNTANQQNLLNLDYLAIANPSGEVLAQGHDQSIFGFSMNNDNVVVEALTGQQVHSLGVRSIKGEDELMVLAAAPIWFANRVIGVVIGGRIIDESWLKNLKALSGAELVLVYNDKIKGTISAGYSQQFRADVASNKSNEIELDGIPYKFGSYALHDFSGVAVADLLIGTNTHDFESEFDNLFQACAIFAGIVFVLSISLAWGFAYKIMRPLTELAESMPLLASGDFTARIDANNNKELGQLVDGFNDMAADLEDSRGNLINSERTAVFMQIADRINREIDVPLTSIRVSMQDLKKAYEQDNQDIQPIFSAISEDISTITGLAGEFSEISRFPEPIKASENIHTLISDLANSHAGEIKSGRLIVNIANGNLMADIDRDQLKRAIDNVLKNALEASRETGRVELKTARDNHYAVIEIADDGSGFSPLARKNLFSPYFTTKAHGRGLGLFITKKIIDEHDGLIEVKDRNGAGSIVRLKLRIAKA